jgi:hypothetical protein
MPVLSFPYRSIIPGGLLRPMVNAVAFNPLNGLKADFIGLLDTGADQVSLTSSLLAKLGIDPDSLEDDQAETPSGLKPIKFCDFLQIGIEHDGVVYFPNGEHPVPLHFSRRSPDSLLGQMSFLRLCIATFNGPGRTVTLDF